MRRSVRHPHPPTEVLLPFVRWLYGTPDTPPYGLLPNMGESSGTRAEPARGSLAQCFPSRALPAPHSGDHYHSGRGMGVVQKNLLLVFPPLASPRVISLQQRARVLFGDRFAGIGTQWLI